nr:hypothetical protein BaRGS_017781 [Batillaria attramentaria]
MARLKIMLVLNLLSAIYRPQNVYCVHVDKKAQKSFRFAMEAIADCFPNVFLASRSVDVRWGKFSVLKPELVCMQDLWNYTHWKYFINLTGQEFPLKTNYELVKILTAYNGANDVIVDPRTWKSRRRWTKEGPPPYGLIPRKGSVHVAVNRDFVDFVLHSPVSRDFLEWCKRTHIPDETFFPTLNRNSQLGIRGSYHRTGEEPWNDSIAHLNMIRYKNWGQFECGRKGAWNWKSIFRKAAPKVFSWEPIKVTEVDCSKVFSGDKMELRKAVQHEKDKSHGDVGMNDSEDLWNYTHWKYFINLTGQEFPLKTNYELVKILTAYNGANDVIVSRRWW